jgi:acyl-CoA synthetase (AMP-forming)/AMP-acid ligase II
LVRDKVRILIYEEVRSGHAVLYLRPGSSVSIDDLLAHCGSIISNDKRPKSFDLRQEPLPLSGAGKILKSELLKPYWEGGERNVG